MNNKTIYFIPFLCFFFSSYAQEDNEIYGYVVIQNSKTNNGELHYVNGVSISSDKGFFKPQITDSNGYFKLICSDKLNGEKIDLKIEKDGYIIINEDLINKGSQVGSKAPLKIVMAKKTNLEASYNKYYDFLRNYYISIKEHRKTNELVRNKLDSLQQTLNEITFNLENKISFLVQSNAEKETVIENLAKELSYTNLDDLSKPYLQVHQEMILGRFEKALELLSKIRFEERFKKGNISAKRNKQRIDSLVYNSELLKKSLEQDLKGLLQRSRLKVMNNDYHGAIQDLELGLSYDDKNVEYLMEIGYINQVLNNSNCLVFYDKVLKLTNDDFIISSVYNNKGVYYKNLKSSRRAGYNLLKAAEIRKRLYDKNKSNGNYVHTLNNCASLFSQQGDLKRSLKYYKHAMQISEALYKVNDSVYSSTYFGVLSNYATFLSGIGEIEDASNIYIATSKLVKAGNNYLSNNEIALFYNNYGRFYSFKLNDNRKAFELYSKGIEQIEKNLPKINQFYSNNSISCDYVLPITLAKLYKNIATTINRENKDKINMCYVRALKIYFCNINGVEKNGVIYLGSLAELQIDYALSFMHYDNEEDIEFAKSIVNEAKKNINQLGESDRRFVIWGNVYRKLSIFHRLEKSKDSSKYYANLEYDFFYKNFRSRPKDGYLDLLLSSNNLAANYILLEIDNNEVENSILKKMRFSLRNFKRYAKSNSFSNDLLIYTQSVILEFKKGIEFGKSGSTENKILIKADNSETH